MTIALKLDYLGTNFHGWQRQKNAPTVQLALEQAFSRLTGKDAAFTGCGRTDAGVHAKGYIASVRESTTIPLDKLPLAMNAQLPFDISVHEAYAVDDAFHPVFSCTAKEYTYTIQNGRVRDPFYGDRALFVPAELDRDAMVQCAKEFLGVHDFAAMRTLGSNVKTTVREVYEVEVSFSGELIFVRIRASGFLYNMARTMTGTLLYAGLGKLREGDIARILESGNRTLAGPTLEARGLCMTGVWYPEPYAHLGRQD
ncbi:MAG: tRNA pseudouridine(38-40) synthase TruA [Oscillospiraceae bacterium]|nr:tRNA pseudouridine(38-40) synthase TruA [Oscillospiraceae bacterium]MBQ3880817.1 tRNA pseudouridine(38-40) synthase TruA [Oscillospiraceae bacterium]